jgi:microcystin-dependent protein
MARPFRHSPALPELPSGAARELIEQFRAVETNLDALREERSITPVLRVRSHAAKLGELVLLEPPPDGTLLVLPAGGPENIGKTILVAVVGGVLSPGVTVSIVGRKGVINGAATMAIASMCLVEFVCCGARGWFSCCTGGGGGGAEAAYPVGSIYLSTNSTNPATSLGFGTWAAFGAGRVPVGFDAGQTEFDADEETGGAKTHTLTSGEMPSHTHVQNSHNHTQNSHNHTQNSFAPRIVNSGTAGTVGVQGASTASNANASNAATTATNQAATATNQAATATNQDTTATNQAATATNQNTGGGGAHNNLQPYIVVRMWKRTA